MSENNPISENNDPIITSYSDESATRDLIHEKFPSLTHQQVLEAVKLAGPVKADVCKYIKEKYKI